MEIFILFAILVAGALIRLPLLKFPIDDDLGYFSYAPWFRHRGVRIGRDIYTRLPMHWFYIAAFSLFGRRPGSVKVFDAIYELVTACVIYALCAIAISSAVGLAAAALYLWFANSESIALFSGCNERYYGLFTTAGFLFLLLGLQAPQGEAAGWFFVCGLFLGGAIYFKDILILNTAAAALTIWLFHSEPTVALLWFGAGFGLVAVVIYLPLIHLNGGIPAFIKLSWEGYKRALQDNPDRGSVGKLFQNAGRFFLETAPLAVVPALAAFTLAPGIDNILGIVLAVWLASSVAVLLIQSVYWPYHFIPFVPLLAVTSAVGVVRFASQYGSLSGETRQLWWIALGVSFSIAGYLQIRALMAGGDPARHSASFTWHKHEQLTVVPKIAEYIRARTSESDYIYQWGYLYHLYMLADRLCPVYGCVTLAPPALPWKLDRLREIVDGLRKNPPKYLVLHLQCIDMAVLERLTGLRYEPEKVFSRTLRLYRLAAVRETAPPGEIDFAVLEELLADSDVPFKRGMELLMEGDTAGAKRQFEKTLSLNPAHPAAIAESGKLALAERDYRQAERFFKTLADRDDPDTRLVGQTLLLDLHLSSGSDDGIESMVDAALAMEPDTELAVTCRVGLYYRRKGDYDKALETYLRKEKAAITVENRQSAASIEYHVAKIYFEKGQYRNSIHHLERCLSLEPIHRAAERMLDRAKTELDGIEVKNILVFRSAQFRRYMDAALTDLRSEYPQAAITMFAQKDDVDTSVNDKRIDRVIRFPYKNFSAFWLLLPSVRRMLKAEKPDIAVIPVSTLTRLQAQFDYFNILLYARLASPKKMYFYKDRQRARQEATVSATFYGIAKKIYETAANPVWFAIDLYRLWNRPDRERIISFTRQPGDLLAHVVKSRWLMKNGVNGISFESYMGNPYTLYYPPLSFALMGRLGPVGYLLLQTALFFSAAAATAIAAGHPWLVLLVPYLVTSWYYRLNTIIVGRVDFLAWGLVLPALTLYYFGHPLPAAIFFSAALYVHTTVTVIGGMGMLAVAASSGGGMPDLFLFGLVTGALSLPWWLPFIRNRGKFGFHRIWGGIAFWKTVYLAYKIPLRQMTLFLAAAALTGALTPVHSIIFVPMSVYLYGLIRKKYIFHVTNLSGGILTFGIFALFVEPSLSLTLLFLVLINLRDPQDDPRIRPLVEDRVLTDTNELFRPVGKNERVALECNQDEFWDDNLNWGWLFSVAANRSDFHLLSGVGFDQVDPVLPLEYETKINSLTDPAIIVELLKTTGCRYVAAYSESFGKKLESMGFEKLAEKEFPPYAYLHKRTYSLYRAPFTVDIIEPAVDWSYIKNGISFTPNGATVYRIKLAYYPGWEASQNGQKLPLEDLIPGMAVTTRGTGEVRLNFRSGLFSR